MKTASLIVSLLAGIVTASPLSVEVRQSTNVGTTANEYTRGGCKDIIFFFARGSTEVGNMVSVVSFWKNRMLFANRILNRGAPLVLQLEKV
jgi:cutinase